MEKIIDKTNLIYGALVAAGTAVFGKYWFLFLGFLLANIVDYVTGYIKAKYWLKNESSEIGAKGVIKKVSYWLVIAIAFFIGITFKDMGDTIGIDLGITLFFGWFTLATYIINELRSILENLIEMDVDVPQFLITGLAIAEKKIKNTTDNDIQEE